MELRALKGKAATHCRLAAVVVRLENQEGIIRILILGSVLKRIASEG